MIFKFFSLSLSHAPELQKISYRRCYNLFTYTSFKVLVYIMNCQFSPINFFVNKFHFSCVDRFFIIYFNVKFLCLQILVKGSVTGKLRDGGDTSHGSKLDSTPLWIKSRKTLSLLRHQNVIRECVAPKKGKIHDEARKSEHGTPFTDGATSF